MGELMTKKQRTVLVAYPLAVFVFFAFLVATSVFVQQFYTQSPHSDDDIVSDDMSPEEKDRRMKSIMSQYNDVVVQPIYQPIADADAESLNVQDAHAAIVLDVDSGTILWEKNSTEKRSIASMTKLVTAMVVVDRIRDLDEIVTIPSGVIPIEGTSVGCPTSVICNSEQFYVGEKVRVRDLLKSALIFSANDAATILGLHVAGSEEAFADLMNARMKEIGAGNTHFCRPSGLEFDADVESCYSSAYDIARVMAHLKQYEKYDVLWEMMRTKETTFHDVDGTVEHELKNTNRLIGDLPYLVGAKTGFTPRAGYCLGLASSDATRKHTVISVVLDDYHRFDDVKMMNEWAFHNFTWQ